MKKIIHEIRQQPLHVRKAFAITLTILTFSAIGLFWAKSTQKQVVAMLNGTQAEQSDIPNKPSPFASIKQSLKDLGATIGAFWSERDQFAPEKFHTDPREPAPTNTLPL